MRHGLQAQGLEAPDASVSGKAQPVGAGGAGRPPTLCSHVRCAKGYAHSLTHDGQGDARYAWMHAVARRTEDVVGDTVIPRGTRLSLTFRRVLDQAKPAP